MKLLGVISREAMPRPWTEGEKIPWNDPAFSRRMLSEHLSQEHDAASRRFAVIDEQIRWIHRDVLEEKPTKILDLGCGPGLYTSRLAKLGHQCIGVDFSPASIAYAREQAQTEGLDQCRYIQQDVRLADFGSGYGLVMLISGELNVFRPDDAGNLLAKAYRALMPAGALLLEPHTFDKVAELARQPTTWNSAQRGLFSDQPHLLLRESSWDTERSVAVQRYYVVDALSGDVTRHSSSTQAYTNEQYRSLLSACGFGEIAFYPSLGNRMQDGFLAIVTRKPTR